MNAEAAESSTKKLLKLTYTECTVGLSIHNLKSYGVGYIMVTKLLLYTLILLTKSKILFHILYIEYCRFLIQFFP
jgi:hypothetical protein